jgi:hypothetical protein
MGKRAGMVHYAAKVAEIYPAAASGTAHVIIRCVKRRLAAAFIEILPLRKGPYHHCTRRCSQFSARN